MYQNQYQNSISLDPLVWYKASLIQFYQIYLTLLFFSSCSLCTDDPPIFNLHVDSQYLNLIYSWSTVSDTLSDFSTEMGKSTISRVNPKENTQKIHIGIKQSKMKKNTGKMSSKRSKKGGLKSLELQAL